MPAITGYEVEWLGNDDDAQRYRAWFTSATATANLVTVWKLVLGQWRIVDFTDIVVEAKEVPPAP
jgi:hypothetical protein